jgi:hypothetical protein
MGVQFLDLSPEAAARIEAFIASLRHRGSGSGDLLRPWYTTPEDTPPRSRIH